MATYKFILFAGNERKDGSFPVSIRITKERKSKLIRTGLVQQKSSGMNLMVDLFLIRKLYLNLKYGMQII